MAFKRKKIKDVTGAFISEPRLCYICKENKAIHSMHGGLVGHYRNYGGKLCCDDCAPGVRAEEQRLIMREGSSSSLSEGGVHMTRTLLTVGVTYMIMALPFFMEKFLPITLKPIQRQLYVLFFVSGLANVIAGLLSIPFTSNGWYVVLIISLLTLTVFAMRMVKTVRREAEKE